MDNLGNRALLASRVLGIHADTGSKAFTNALIYADAHTSAFACANCNTDPGFNRH
jgi:hypothetical protein